MKSTVLLIATSLILVVAMVPITNPNPVRAQTGISQWCWTDVESVLHCFDSNDACLSDSPRAEVIQEGCHKEVVNVQWCWDDQQSNKHCFATESECKADIQASNLPGNLFVSSCVKISQSQNSTNSTK
jgi:hypothetical protein